MKSVSSLFSRKPRSGTTMPLPPVDSIVSVYDTTLPHRSAVVRCVVEVPPSSTSTAATPTSSHAAVVAVRRSRRHRLGRRGRGVDEAGALGGEPVREQLLQRHVDVIGIADVGVAVGVRERARLEVVVQRLRAVEAGEVELLEDVQRLADRRAAARGRRHAVDVEPAVVDERRLAERCVVGGEVGSLE